MNRPNNHRFRLLALLLGFCLLEPVHAPVAAQDAGDAQLEAFLDDFFARFSKLSAQRRANPEGRAMIPLMRLTRSSVERSPARRRDTVTLDPSQKLIAKLWLHGPKEWTVTEMSTTGETAFAKVFFRSVMAGRPDPIPFGIKFRRAGASWKISGFVDLRSVPEQDSDWHELIVTASATSPEAAFTAYMDEIEQYYSPRRAEESLQLAPQVQEDLAPMWLPTEDATKSLSRSMLTFSQIQPRNWKFVSSDIVGEDAQLVIEASSGNPVMRRNLGMAKMMGSGLMFTLERIEEDWLLKDYGRASGGGGE